MEDIRIESVHRSPQRKPHVVGASMMVVLVFVPYLIRCLMHITCDGGLEPPLDWGPNWGMRQQGAM